MISSRFHNLTEGELTDVEAYGSSDVCSLARS